MIYFIINNTYHWYDVDLLANQLLTHDLGLIQIPYSLIPIEDDPRFKTMDKFPRFPFTAEYLNNWPKQLLPNFRKSFKILHLLNNNLHFKKDDVLFVFTEEELLNQYIISKCKRNGGSVFLIEDGAATSIFFNMSSDKLSKRATVLKWLFRIVYGIKGYFPFNIDGYYSSRMSDKYFSGICFFLPTTINRNIPVLHLKKDLPVIEKNRNVNNALFINAPVYAYYTDFNSYLVILDSIIAQLSKNFDKIIFKYHQDDIELGNEKLINVILHKYNNIEIIEKNDIIENIVFEYDIFYAVSFFSSALKNLLFYGIEPVYIYHLLEFFKDFQRTGSLNRYLTNLGYNFPVSFDDIKPGYKSGILNRINEGISINEVIEQGWLNKNFGS